MNVQLMTGSNQVMKHITSMFQSRSSEKCAHQFFFPLAVATNLDGTVTGNFKYPCPAVRLSFSFLGGIEIE